MEAGAREVAIALGHSVTPRASALKQEWNVTSHIFVPHAGEPVWSTGQLAEFSKNTEHSYFSLLSPLDVTKINKESLQKVS